MSGVEAVRLHWRMPGEGCTHTHTHKPLTPPHTSKQAQNRQKTRKTLTQHCRSGWHAPSDDGDGDCARECWMCAYCVYPVYPPWKFLDTCTGYSSNSTSVLGCRYDSIPNYRHGPQQRLVVMPTIFGHGLGPRAKRGSALAHSKLAGILHYSRLLPWRNRNLR